MALSGVWSTPVEHFDGELLTAAKVNAWQNNLLHLASRPDAFAYSAGTNQTSTSTTYVQATNPTISFTPKVTGNILVIVVIELQSSVVGDVMSVRLDANGVKSSVFNQWTHTANTGYPVHFAYTFAVTANTTYTIKPEFNRVAGTGTITFNSAFSSMLYAIEVG